MKNGLVYIALIIALLGVAILASNIAFDNRIDRLEIKYADIEREFQHQARAIEVLQQPAPEPPRLPPADQAFLLWPIHPDDYRSLTSPYGIRRSPLYGGEYRQHMGTDIVGVWRARIRAAADGFVSDVYPPPDGYWRGHDTKGGYIEITHADGWITRYAHLHEIIRRYWVIGAPVLEGETIGRQGNTGLSMKDHLHFEVLHNGRHVNPLKYTRECE